jgi:hypothetical protein
MRSIIWFVLLFIVGCNETEVKANRSFETKNWHWEPIPAPEPEYACYRYFILNKNWLVDDVRYLNIVCVNKPQVTN